MVDTPEDPDEVGLSEDARRLRAENENLKENYSSSTTNLLEARDERNKIIEEYDALVKEYNQTIQHYNT